MADQDQGPTVPMGQPDPAFFDVLWKDFFKRLGVDGPDAFFAKISEASADRAVQVLQARVQAARAQADGGSAGNGGTPPTGQGAPGAEQPPQGHQPSPSQDQAPAAERPRSGSLMQDALANILLDPKKFLVETAGGVLQVAAQYKQVFSPHPLDQLLVLRQQYPDYFQFFTPDPLGDHTSDLLSRSLWKGINIGAAGRGLGGDGQPPFGLPAPQTRPSDERSAPSSVPMRSGTPSASGQPSGKRLSGHTSRSGSPPSGSGQRPGSAPSGSASPSASPGPNRRLAALAR